MPNRFSNPSVAYCLKYSASSGNFFVKVFQGDLLNDYIKTLKEHFETVKLIKPKASRQQSSEMYLLAMDMKPDKTDQTPNLNKV